MPMKFSGSKEPKVVAKRGQPVNGSRPRRVEQWNAGDGSIQEKRFKGGRFENVSVGVQRAKVVSQERLLYKRF